MSELCVELQDMFVKIENDDYSKSNLLFFDMKTSELIDGININIIGSICKAVSIDNILFGVNNCGFYERDPDKSVFNADFQLVSVDVASDEYKIISKRMDDIYKVVDIFIHPNTHNVIVILIRFSDELVTIEFVEFTRKLEYFGKPVSLHFYKDKQLSPFINVRSKCTEERIIDIDFGDHLPFKENRIVVDVEV